MLIYKLCTKRDLIVLASFESFTFAEAIILEDINVWGKFIWVNCHGTSCSVAEAECSGGGYFFVEKRASNPSTLRFSAETRIAWESASTLFYGLKTMVHIPAAIETPGRIIWDSWATVGNVVSVSQKRVLRCCGLGRTQFLQVLTSVVVGLPRSRDLCLDWFCTWACQHRQRQGESECLWAFWGVGSVAVDRHQWYWCGTLTTISDFHPDQARKWGFQVEGVNCAFFLMGGTAGASACPVWSMPNFPCLIYFLSKRVLGWKAKVVRSGLAYLRL